LETEPKLIETYVADGRVRLIAKNLVGAEVAQKAAEANECASQQGKFWEMRDLLYEKSNEWSSAADPAGFFQDYAQTVGLDMPLYNECYDSGAGQAQWQWDMGVAQSAEVNSTPTFFVIRLADGVGTRVPGFLEFAQFQEVLDQLLAEPANP
jgi:protein-disulfide isomerase